MTLADINWAAILAGLGLFLFGIDYMGDGLKNFSGDKLKGIIDKYTSSPLKGILVGAGVTCLIQSSSGTTALTIGLIRSGLMTLQQGVGIIMGANIGTTITAFIVGLKISKYATYFIIIGAFLLMFSKSKQKKYFGQILFGFGCLFYGLELMGNHLQMISQIPEFTQFTQILATNPLLALLGGTIMTCAIQSSSAVIAIVQQMYGIGAINLSIALPFLFGSNIGTTITAVMASLGGSNSAKRAATFHVLFNVIGTVFFMILLDPFYQFILYINSLMTLTPEMQLAVAHGIFNVTTTVLLYPFINKMVQFIKIILPHEDSAITMDLSELDENVVSLFPSNALGIAKNKTLEMGNLALDSLNNLKGYFYTKENKHFDFIQEAENVINMLDEKITQYLLLISQEQLNDHDSRSYYACMKAIKDIERISDLTVHISQFLNSVYDNKESFTSESLKDIDIMMTITISMLDQALLAFDKHDPEVIEYVDQKESDLDIFNRKAKSHYLKRMTEGSETAAFINSSYIDILSNLERIGDHCQNIAEAYDIDEETFIL
ncbi:MAG: Na/Pi cotransporter family protein [Faecalibacillus sp.]